MLKARYSHVTYLERVKANEMQNYQHPIFSDERGKLMVIEALNSVPSKVLNYLRYGKPILAIAPSESSVSNIIQESNSGVCLPTFELETMARELIALQQLDSTDRVKLGRNGRNYFINHFASSKNLERLCRLVVGAGRLDT